MPLSGCKSNFIKGPRHLLIFMQISYHSNLPQPAGFLTSHYSASVLCVLKWLGQEVLSNCTSIGWLLIHLGAMGVWRFPSRLSRLP